MARETVGLVQLSVGRSLFLPLRLGGRDVPHDRHRSSPMRSSRGRATRWCRTPKRAGRQPDLNILSFGSPDGRFGPFKNLAVVLTNDSYAMLFGQRNGKPTLVVFVVARDTERGLPVTVYGYVTDPQPFLAPIFANLRGASG